MIQYGPLTLDFSSTYTSLSVVKCDPSATSVDIPRRCQGLSVLFIGPHAFENCSSLREVIFSDACAIAEIGEYAFSGCTALTQIHLPDSVCVIDRGAFFGCTALERADFKSSAFVGPYAFSDCTALADLPALSCVCEGSFRSCEALTALTFADGLTEIGESAFEGCTALTQLTLPHALERIETLAFRSCTSLSEVVFLSPDGWYESCGYCKNDGALDLSDPARNAEMLSGMDFEDDVFCWYRKKE